MVVMKKDTNIAIAVCYHKKSLILETDALTPMQLGHAVAKTDLGMRGDDTGDNISARNRFYSEDTALWWLWKNSKAKVKGCMHYRRLLDLKNPGRPDYDVALEDIRDTREFLVKDMGLDSENINRLLKTADILTANSLDVGKWSAPTVEGQFKSVHVPFHWDIAMDIVKRDFPDVYPTALRVSGGNMGHFHNLVIMKADLFDAMCEFCFHITETMSHMIDETRPEFNDNWRATARYLSFVWERMCGVYLEYLVSRGHKLIEFPAVSIAPRGTNIEDLRNYNSTAYDIGRREALVPAFDDKSAVAVMMATNDNYAPYCAVMLQSIISNAASGRKYDIVIAASDLSEYNNDMISAMATPNVSVRIIDIKNYVGDADLNAVNASAKFGAERYYRYFIPEIFANYDKVLYLDADMVANRDIAELYDTNIGDNWWGVTYDKGVATVCSTPYESWGTTTVAAHLKNVLKMDSVYDYFQTGVMIWNIKRCRADKVTAKCLDKLQEIKQLLFLSQDVMNAVANGKHVFWLSPYWNVAWNPKYDWGDYSVTESYKTAVWWTGRAYILHYCGNSRPWNQPQNDYAEYFWKYARQTPYYEKILAKAMASIAATGYYNKPNKSKIRRIKRKIKKYKILQALTLGMVKSFKKRKANWRQELARC